VWSDIAGNERRSISSVLKKVDGAEMVIKINEVQQAAI